MGLCVGSDICTRERHGFAQYFDITNMVAEQQNQFGIDQRALLVRQIAMRVNQRFIKIIARREVSEIAFASLVKIRL